MINIPYNHEFTILTVPRQDREKNLETILRQNDWK
jgi:hypothetical protein